MHNRKQIETHYLHDVYNPKTFIKKINKVANFLKLATEKYDTIAFSGTSGAAFAYPLSYILGKHLICIRKNTDNSHFKINNLGFEGFLKCKRYIIIDDCIDSGATVSNIIYKINLFYENYYKRRPAPKLHGVVLYDDIENSNKSISNDISFYSAETKYVKGFIESTNLKK
jgi:phosphoribosylpyrophosphate synthetase